MREFIIGTIIGMISAYLLDKAYPITQHPEKCPQAHPVSFQGSKVWVCPETVIPTKRRKT